VDSTLTSDGHHPTGFEDGSDSAGRLDQVFEEWDPA
jgi:hypothetical protein